MIPQTRGRGGRASNTVTTAVGGVPDAVRAYKVQQTITTGVPAGEIIIASLGRTTRGARARTSGGAAGAGQGEPRLALVSQRVETVVRTSLTCWCAFHDAPPSL